jgi:hypothetical protein
MKIPHFITLLALVTFAQAGENQLFDGKLTVEVSNDGSSLKMITIAPLPPSLQ